MTLVLFVASLRLEAQPPTHGFAQRTAIVDLSAVAAKQARLAEAGLLERVAKPPRVKAPLAPAKERPRHGNLVRVPAALPAAAAARFDSPGAISPDTPRTLSGFPALDDNQTTSPPDTMGAVGPRHVVTTLNSEILIQDRQGKTLSRVVLEDFWQPAGEMKVGTDPRILYDRSQDRWVFSTLAEPAAMNSALYVGVTQTGDPTGRWNLYRMPATLFGSWSDYPTMALAGPWILITTPRFSLSSNNYAGTTIWVFTKDDLYGGTGAYRTFTDQLANAPVNGDARRNRAPIVTAVNGPRGQIAISEVRGSPGSETYVAAAAPLVAEEPWAFETRDLPGPQLDSSDRLDLGDDRMQHCVSRSSTIWCAHTIFLPLLAPSRAAVQWLEIGIEENGYRLIRQGRLDDARPGDMYAFPSLAVNRDNDVLLGYSRMSNRQFVSANFAFRAGTDPAGQFQADTVFKQGEAVYRSPQRQNRWGDYSQTVVDPVDDLTLWTIQEYAASPTPLGRPRWGTWWAAVTPLPLGSPPCVYTLSAASIPVSSNGGTATAGVRTARDCRWMAAPNAPWVNVSSGAPGQGDGSVTFAVEPNRSTAERRATVSLAGQTLTVIQGASTDAAELAVTMVTAPESVTLLRGFNVSAAVRNQGTRPAGSFAIGFFLSPRPLVSASDFFTGVSCAVPENLAPGQAVTCNGSVLLPATIPPGVYYLAAIADYQNRLQLPYRENAIRTADTGALLVVIPPNGPRFATAAVTHAASNASGVVSPGQLVVIYGSRLGPDRIEGAQLQGGRLVTTLAGTTVSFDGIPAPLIYVSEGQVAAIAPFALANRRSTRVQVIAGGLPSAVAEIGVAALAPALFTANFSGRGAVAALNQDSSANLAARPAQRGEIVQLFATGFGALEPAVADGGVIGSPLPRLTAPVTVRIGGRPARVTYAGPAPGTVAGVVQINAEIAADAAAGESAVEVSAGGAASPPGTTIFVR